MRSRDPFRQALEVLRTAVTSAVAPGSHLPINDAAHALGLSTSPVREALSRLCGEGLIEDRRGFGYFTRDLPTEDLVGLLRLEQLHVELALSLTGEARPLGPEVVDLHDWAAALMERCDCEPVKESYARLASRLAPLRHEFSTLAADFQDSDFLEAQFSARLATAAATASRARRWKDHPLKYIKKIV
jgi:DNA-binding GntR family transcriptional regulator